MIKTVDCLALPQTPYPYSGCIPHLYPTVVGLVQAAMLQVLEIDLESSKAVSKKFVADYAFKSKFVIKLLKLLVVFRRKSGFVPSFNRISALKLQKITF